MIFVTVGTHEQPFDRLVSAIDALKGKGVVEEDVIIQTGYSTYEPKHCTWSKLLPYSDMVKYVKDARIVITHGGPSSFIMPLQEGKIPVVVPRQEKYGEHVNNHQLAFCREVQKRQKNILVVQDMEQLCDFIVHYDEKVKALSGGYTSNNEVFNRNFCDLIKDLF